jgi:hypothetical protein
MSCRAVQFLPRNSGQEKTGAVTGAGFSNSIAKTN